MADQQDFELLLPILKAIPKKDIRRPDMPVVQAIKEAEIMAEAAAQDNPTFVAVGLSKDEAALLAQAAGALRYSEAVLTAALGEIKDASKQWLEKEPQGYELRADILAAVSYALRSIPDASKSIKKIREGAGGFDMIQDLLALSELGKKYKEQLQKINFDLTKLDTAAELADQLGRVFSKAFIEKGSSGPKDLRDRAFSYMRSIMSEILAVAEYVFRKDTSRLDYYYSSFRSSRYSSSEEGAPVAAPAAATAK
jgi:hypothetical protein